MIPGASADTAHGNGYVLLVESTFAPDTGLPLNGSAATNANSSIVLHTIVYNPSGIPQVVENPMLEVAPAGGSVMTMGPNASPSLDSTCAGELTTPGFAGPPTRARCS